MTEQLDLKERIRVFVKENLAEGKGVTVASDDDSLVDNGVVDSLGVFQLVSFLEDTFDIRIADGEIVLGNFGSINDIEKFVRRKQAGA